MKCFVIIIPYLFLGLFFSINCNSASFDCQRAATNVEKMICSDTQLSQMDNDLASLYTEVLLNAVDPELQKQQQRGWLRKTRNLCTNVPCLIGAYSNRMNELASLMKNDNQLPKTTKSKDEVCNLVAEYANRGALSVITVPKMDIEVSEKQLEKIKQLTYDHINEIWSFDFNRDGIQDIFAINYEGSMGVGSAYLLSGEEGSSVFSIYDSDDDDDFYDLWFLTIEGRFFVLSGNRQRLGRLREIDETCEFHYICSYAQKEKPRIELIKGEDNQMCLKAGMEDVHHVDYTYLHSIRKIPHSSGFIKEGLAKVDIDNDGKPDNIVRVDFSSGGGRGWDATYIATTDETRTNIPSNKLNDLLLHELGGIDGPDMSVFVYNGATYLDTQGKDGDRKIYWISGSQVELICEFYGRITNYDKKGY